MADRLYYKVDRNDFLEQRQALQNASLETVVCEQYVANDVTQLTVAVATADGVDFESLMGAGNFDAVTENTFADPQSVGYRRAFAPEIEGEDWDEITNNLVAEIISRRTT